MRFPHRIEKLAILNVPHPAVMLRNLRTNPRQMLRSWYMLFFQIPRCRSFCSASIERAAARLRTAAVRHVLGGGYRSLPRGMGQPGALTAMINWYRALFREMPDREAVEIAGTRPTRILWGMKDRFLLSAMAAESLKYCDRGRAFRVSRGNALGPSRRAGASESVVD